MTTKEIIEISLDENKKEFARLDEISLQNQKKVLAVFKKNRVALMHFNGTNGYGYDDIGRDTLNNVVADIFGAEKAVAGPMIASGTHAITLALFGILRPNDDVLAISGEPYDTLQQVIYGEGNGSLRDFGIKFSAIPLVDGDFDKNAIKTALENKKYKMVYLQRSRGYEARQAFSIERIENICRFVREYAPETIIFCDNCYGEFIDIKEPTEVGVDICAGSFIKNIGGGIAPTGGYVVGRADLVDLVAGRLTVPSIGCEIGSYSYGYREFYQGIFNAPHAVNQALKCMNMFVRALNKLGFRTVPNVDEHFNDIVCSVYLQNEKNLVDFCNAIQSSSPVDSFVNVEPWDMPGYEDKVIMAAGCFVQGASLELSCDGPIREPYIAYLQGGLTLEHGLVALEAVLDSLTK